MNNTLSFELYEKQLLPLASGIGVILLSGSIYFLARYWGQPKEKETFKQKLYLVQSLVSAFLLGQIVAHTTLFTEFFALQYGYLFVLGGILFLRHAESIGRGWNADIIGESTAGEVSTSSANHDFDDVNPNTMEQEEYIHMTDVGSKQAAAIQWKVRRKRQSNAKRQWMLAFLIAAFTVVATANGFLLLSRPATSFLVHLAHIICFLVNCLAQTMAILGGMLHAGFHVTEEKRRRFAWWIAVTFFWLCVIVLSSIPVLLDLTPLYAHEIVNTPYFSGIYLFATGILWRLSYYYEKHLYICRNRRELFVDAALFTLALAISGATGFWL